MRNLFIDKMHLVFLALGALLIIFLARPILGTITATSPALLWETLLTAEVYKAILRTFYASFLATLIAFWLGVPLAYLLARFEFPGKELLQGLIDLPIVVPHSAAGIALLMTFGRRMWLGRLFERIGIRFVSEFPGIVIAMLFVSLSFLLNAAREGFEAVDPRLERVARTLGATPWQTFWRISFPLAWRSILSGLIMMWARGLSEFGAVVILVYHPMVAPVLIYERFESFGLDYARPIAALLILICLAIFVLLRLTTRKEARHE